MNKMKKVALLITMLTVLALALVGCGPVSDTDNVSGDNQEQQNTNNSGDVNEDVNNVEVENKYDGIENNPVVTFEIEDMGTIKMELYPQIAPETVENFIELVQSGFYDGLIFHRVIPGFMIQGGDPSGDGTGGPGYSILGEFALNGYEQNSLSHTRGIVSMARGQEYNSAGSQFFIVTTDSTFLDGQYAAFGNVIEGMDVADNIVNSEVIITTEEIDQDLYYTNPDEYIRQYMQADRPVNPPVIKTATVETFGVEYDSPNKITAE